MLLLDWHWEYEEAIASMWHCCPINLEWLLLHRCGKGKWGLSYMLTSFSWKLDRIQWCCSLTNSICKSASLPSWVSESANLGSEMMLGSWLMILSWIWVYRSTPSLNTDGIFPETSIPKVSRFKNGTASSLSLASSFVCWPYHNGIQNILGDTFGGTVYPEDISCGGTQYPRMLCTGIQKNWGC